MISLLYMLYYIEIKQLACVGNMGLMGKILGFDKLCGIRRNCISLGNKKMVRIFMIGTL